MPDEVLLIKATKKNGDECAYAGNVGSDGFTYFNDGDFYRFKQQGTWEDNLYILNRYRNSWCKCSVFEKLSVENINSGGGSVAPGKGVEDAVKYAIGIASDNSHGYDQSNRWGPDFDCSSFVYESFRVGGGFDLPVHSGNTYTMRNDFTKIGFKWYGGMGNTSSNLQRGDILLNISSHTEIYIGENQNVGAHMNEFGGISGGRSGDQTGEEISTNGWYAFPWDGILRYED